MATIKLTDATWLEQESNKVAGVLRSDRALGGKDGFAGKDAEELVAMLKYAGLEYAGAQLNAIKTKLIADGVIEVV